MDSIHDMLKTSNVNVGQKERAVSLVSGAALAAFGLLRRSWLRAPLALGGAYMIYRGISGSDPLYKAIGLNRAGQNGAHGLQVVRSFTINRPRSEVYRYWRNFENLPNFMTHLEAVQVYQGPNGRERSRWSVKAPVPAPLGRTVDWEAEIYSEKENEEIAWRSLPGSEIENQGVVRFKDAPGGRGTEVIVQLRYQPPAGTASAALARLLGEEPKIQVRDDLRHFKEILETGEIPTVFGQTSGRVKQVLKEREEIASHRNKDVVQEASEQSFPASDPPGWAK